MAFIETLEKIRVYLESKPSWTKEESSLLAQVREDLNGFPISVLSRCDLAEHGFEAHLADDADMAIVARKMGEDYWSQLSGVQIPIIGEYQKIPTAECPLCSSEATFEDGTWTCDNHECRTSWCFMKYTLVEDIELAGIFRIKEIGYQFSDNKFGAMLIPVDKYRTHTGKEPEKSTLFHLITITDDDIVNDLTQDGFTFHKIQGFVPGSFPGENEWWMSCYNK